MVGMGVTGVLERVMNHDVPRDARPIRGKFVYKVKALQNGQILKFKTRFVAQGFRQRPSLDYDENGTYAPEFAMTSHHQADARCWLRATPT